MALPHDLRTNLRIPVVAAPMTGVSSPELVAAAAWHGIMAGFPAHNAGAVTQLDEWFARIRRLLKGQSEASDKTADPTGGDARDHSRNHAYDPWNLVTPNLIVHRTNEALADQVACLLNHGVRRVITSVGSPAGVAETLHSAGVELYADVATVKHARSAISAGADGLVLLTAGAGGQTGSANPFAFVRAVREFYDGPVVLAGGITDGASVLAALTLGADLAYMGTRFIATEESHATSDYRSALVAAGMDDVRTVTKIGGLPTNVLAAWDESASAGTAGRGNREPDVGFSNTRLLASKTAWGAGHSAFGVHRITTVAELIAELEADIADIRIHSPAPVNGRKEQS